LALPGLDSGGTSRDARLGSVNRSQVIRVLANTIDREGWSIETGTSSTSAADFLPHPLDGRARFA